MTGHMLRRSRAIDLSILAGLAALVVLLYHSVMSLDWIYDDPFNLRFVQSHEVTGYFFSPDLWKELPFRMFTPLLYASLEVDDLLWPANPVYWYGHQLVAVVLAVWCLYGVLRLFWDHTQSSVIAILFLLGVPFKGWIAQLMCRHYVEGFVLACLAMATWIVSVRSNRSSLALLSGALYLGAMLAKEIYVPLPILFFLTSGEASRRIRHTLPHAASVLIYMIWRRGMIGTWLGGYGWSSEPGSLGEILVGVPAALIGHLAGHAGWFAMVNLVAILAFIGIASQRSRRFLVAISVATLGWAAPLFSVWKSPEDRYLVVLWLILAAGAVIGIGQLRLPARTSSITLLTLLAVSMFANRLDWWSSIRELEAMSAESRFVLSKSEPFTLSHPLAPPATIAELDRLRGDREMNAEFAWFYDDIALCEAGALPPVWAHGDRGAAFVRLSVRELEAMKATACDHPRTEPMSAVFSFRRGIVSWKLGPYHDGSWAVLFPGARAVHQVGSVGGFRVGDQRSFDIQLRYTAPAGWTTYSPILHLDFEQSSEVRWSRQ